MRDEAAEKRGIAERFDPLHGTERQEKRPALVKTADRMARMDGWARAAALWGALALGGGGTLDAAKGVGHLLQQISLPGAGAGTEGRLPSFKPGQEMPKAYNKDLRQGHAGPIYSLEPARGVEVENLPIHYYTALLRDETGLRFAASEEVAVAPEGREAFRLKSEIPHYKGEMNEVSIPMAVGYRISAIDLRDSGGDRLRLGVDYALRNDPLSGVLFAELTDMNRWTPDEAFTFSVSYEPTDEVRERDTEAFRRLEVARLSELNLRLREAGFEVLSQGIDRLLAEAETGAKPVTLGELAAVFQDTGTYYSKKVSSPIPEDKWVNEFSEFAHFLKDGRLHCQCDGGNQLFAKFLKAYYQSDPEVSVFNQHVFQKSKAATAVMGADSHLQTVVATRDGKHTWILDATPKAPDEKPVRKDRTPWTDPLVADPRRLRQSVWIVEAGEESGPSREGGGRRPPHPRAPVSPEVHLERLQRYRELRQAMVDNRFYRELPRHLRQEAMPMNRALRLGRLLAHYSSASMSFRLFLSEMARIYPGVFRPDQIAGPADVPALLSAIHRAELERIARLQDKLMNREVLKYAALGNDALIQPVGDLLRFYASTNWTPVRKKPWLAHPSCVGPYRDMALMAY